MLIPPPKKKKQQQQTNKQWGYLQPLGLQNAHTYNYFHKSNLCFLGIFSVLMLVYSCKYVLNGK